MDSASQSYDPTRASKKIEQIFTGIVKAMQKTGFLTHHLSAAPELLPPPHELPPRMEKK